MTAEEVLLDYMLEILAYWALMDEFGFDTVNLQSVSDISIPSIIR